MVESEQYVYKALEPAKRQIRVLHLKPATTWYEEISGKLAIISLDDSPQFEALSYVWGDPQDTAPVHLDGFVFQVTRNLEAAVRRLRKRAEERVIWIDQLCINQTDLDEKSIQVAIMPQIYQSCSEVVLWLGEIDTVDEITVEDAGMRKPKPNDLAAAGMAIIQEYANERHVQELSCFKLINESTLALSTESTIGFEGLSLITSLPYWDRAWIVQENILPAKATVVLGSSTMPWKTVLHACSNWGKHSLDCCRLLSDSLPLEMKNMLLAFFSKLTNISAVNTIRTVEPGACLIDLLRHTRARQASDDRDKIFSVLGLVTTWLNAEPIMPDYTLTKSQLYAMVTEHIITSMSGSLLVFFSNHRRRPEFPSWVHDWAAPDNSEYPYENGWLDHMWWQYNASSKLPATIKRQGESILHIDGYYIDRIVAVGDVMEVNDWKSAVPIFDSWTAMTGVDKDPTKPYVTGGDIDKALWRCLLGNSAFTGKAFTGNFEKFTKLTEEHYPTYELWKKEIRTVVEGQWMLSAETVSVYMVVAISARHRRMFVTEMGYFGMGGPATAVGDDVHLLLGSNVPFVTRPLAGDADSRPLDPSIKHYTLVGECYLHGIMDGEVLLDPKFEKETIALC